MQFNVIGANRRLPDNPIPNSCYLRVDNWNDYHYRTLFKLHYSDFERAYKSIGYIKIMEKGQTTSKIVQLPGDQFESLAESYCSLGQEQTYYEELMSLSEDIRSDILESLRDCVHDADIYYIFKDEGAMKTSLLRAVRERDILEKFRNILLGNSTPTPYNFQFRLKENDNCVLKVKVKPHSKPPTNVHVLIGRNGVGKTRILSGIADKLTENKFGRNKMSIGGELEFPDESEEEGRFANLVTIVFSAFDNFTPIKQRYVKGDIRYQYVGLKKFLDKEKSNKVEFKTLENLSAEFNDSLKICLETQRKTRWLDAIKILNSDPIFAEYSLQDSAQDHDSTEDIANIFNQLSSGHKIILLSITKLVELVEERTLVLIDEPENHLHPPLLASFTRALSDLLIKRNGVAIIATHSPVVLQEVPSSCVTIIDRVNSVFSFYSPSIETFGENVGTLTRESFKLEVTESGFYKMITEYLKHHDYKDLIWDFDDQIGSEGKAIARSFQITNKKEDE